ncbi:MAG: RNA-guided endonuclease InsQ/TnpB family protein, partial [Xenococcaceae cyanobacterium]
MKLTHQYKLKPNSSQVTLMETWLDLLKRQYNYRLRERFDWWDNNRCYIDRCTIINCGIVPLTDKPTKYSQQADILNTKDLFPEYKGIYSQVLQDCIHRVDKTFERYIKGDNKGKARHIGGSLRYAFARRKRSGRPRFKSKTRYNSFTYTQFKNKELVGNIINLPKIGKIKLILHRPIPDGFQFKTATISRRADGWYINISLEDKSVPTQPIYVDCTKICGIDLGLKDFLVTDRGQSVSIPQFARKSEKRLKLIYKSFSRKKKKGGKNRGKAGIKLKKHYQKIARQRKDFHFKTSLKLLQNYDVIAHEDLNIKGLAKTRLAKSILDAGWSQFISILSSKAESAGLLVIGVNPKNTTQNCSSCGNKVPKQLLDRWHSCNCG